MRNKIRLEDFPNVEHRYEKYYAYNSDTGECAIFNDEKKLLFHRTFSPHGKLECRAMYQLNLNYKLLNWTEGDVIFIGWMSTDCIPHKLTEFGLYNIKTRQYVVPITNYYDCIVKSAQSGDSMAVFFKTKNSLFIVDNDGNLLGKFSNSEYYIKPDFYNFESKTLVVAKEIKNHGIKYKYGVYSFKQKKLILPVEFDYIDNTSILGFIVAKKDKMGIYSYEGDVLTELACHYIEPICNKYLSSPMYKTLVKIHKLEKTNIDSSIIKSGIINGFTHHVGVFTLDHQCIIPMEYKAIYYYGDEFFIVQNYNLSWTVYSVSKKKALVPPCTGVQIILDKDKPVIHAVKYVELSGHSGYTVEEESINFKYHRGFGIIEPEVYKKHVRPNYNFDICFDIYSIDGTLIEKDVTSKLSSHRFCNCFNDSCVPSSINESR